MAERDNVLSGPGALLPLSSASSQLRNIKNRQKTAADPVPHWCITHPHCTAHMNDFSNHTYYHFSKNKRGNPTQYILERLKGGLFLTWDST